MSPENSKRTTNRAIVSLGSNIEPTAEYLRKAIAALSALPETTFERASSFQGIRQLWEGDCGKH